ncbi:MAG: Alkaline phosphatase [Sporomusa sp.]|nr:Alkaline phosphatase [Sporomusa sp.]
MYKPSMSVLSQSRYLQVVVALAVIASFLTGTTVTYAAYSAPQVSDINVLPIERAKFLIGQKFDFAIEVNTEAPAKTIEVLVNGMKAEKYFGKEANIKFDKMSTYRINDVAFTQAGKVAVIVNVKTEQGMEKRYINYDVTAEKASKQAKNVILFVGDGMSLQARQIGRILSKGITEGKYNGLLEMDSMSNVAIVTTSGNDSLVTDSANSASAYATGHKTAVNAMGVYADSTKDPLDDPKVENIIELAKRTRGMSTGIVSTANITDATPAAMLAHTRRRSEQNFIAQDMLNPAHRPDVVLGGGSRHFLPKSVPGSKRTDDRNLITEFKDQGYAVATNKTELKATSSSKLLGLFQLDNMDVYVDREVTKNPAVLGKFTDQPTLMDMTKTAIDSLSKNSNGFFLMVEGACIDKQLHTLDWQRAAYDTIEMDKAVGIAKEFAKKNGDTLIVVVADHAHGASITGTYHELDGKTGRDAVRIYGDAGWTTFADIDGDGFPDDPNPSVTLAVQYANHPDYYENYRFQEVPTAPAIMVNGKAVANAKRSPQGGEHKVGNIPTSDPSEVHSADDVPLTAEGPGSEYFKGVLDNTEVFYGMVRALGLDGRKNIKK